MDISLRRASVIQFGANIGKTAIGALATLYFVNVLGPGTFGKYVLTMALVNWTLILSSGPMSATGKRVSEGTNRQRYLTGGLGATLLFLVLPGVGVLLLRTKINDYLGYPGATAIFGLIIAVGLFRFSLEVLRAEGFVERASALDGGQSIFQSLSQAVLAASGFGLVGLLIGEFVAAVAGVIAGAFLTSLRFAWPDRNSVRRLYDYGKYSWISGVKGVSYGWIDTLVLGFLVTDSIVGVYEIAWRISALFVILASALGTVAFPQMSNLSSKGDLAAINTIANRIMSFATLIAIPGLVGAFLLGKEVLALYGESVSEVGVGPLILLILITGRLAESYEFILLRALAALDFPDRTFRVDITFLVSNLVLNLVLGWFFGAVGVASATAFSITLSTTLCWYYLPTEVRALPSPRMVGGQVVASVLMGGVLFICVRFYPPDSIARTLLYAGLGASLYGGLILVLLPEIREIVVEALLWSKNATS